jgi:hypothetical protein
MVRKADNGKAGRKTTSNAVPAGVQANEEEMKAKAVEIRTTFGKGVKGSLDAGKLVAEYQDKLADRGLFKKFWKDFLKWPKTRVYRLIDAHRYFGQVPEETLGMFDLSAIYTLSGEGVKVEARNKAIQNAESGEFVTNAVANKLLGKVARTTSSTPGKITVNRRKLTAEAKKLDIDAKKVLELWERLGITVVFEDAKPKAKVA